MQKIGFNIATLYYTDAQNIEMWKYLNSDWIFIESNSLYYAQLASHDVMKESNY